MGVKKKVESITSFVDSVSAILSPIVVYLNHGNDHLQRGSFLYCNLILLKNYNLTAAFCANFERIYLSFFLHIEDRKKLQLKTSLL